MLLDRLRLGELITGASALILTVLLFLRWAEPEGSLLRDPGADVPAPLEPFADATVDGYVDRFGQSGWSVVGWALVILLVLTIAGALATVALTASRAPASTALAAAVITVPLGLITTLVLLVRLTLAQPALDLGLADEDVALTVPALLGLLALIGVTAGAWLVLRDERTDAPFSAPPEVPVRPAPPPTVGAR